MGSAGTKGPRNLPKPRPIPQTLLRAAILHALREGEVRSEDYVLNALCPATEDPTGAARVQVREHLGRMARANDLDLLVHEGYRLHKAP